jgi:hypothetical protein
MHEISWKTVPKYGYLLPVIGQIVVIPIADVRRDSAPAIACGLSGDEVGTQAERRMRLRRVETEDGPRIRFAPGRYRPGSAWRRGANCAGTPVPRSASPTLTDGRAFT